MAKNNTTVIDFHLLKQIFSIKHFESQESIENKYATYLSLIAFQED